ncbi:type II toxin-antitoxin system RelE family toxin [Aminipila sp.]|uniref:type II toxin-antitoxin system RelE family toxin n=1 Tax=Aminipila sp. TaxID=2060095 RepID=UPI0028968C96|nr:type II toxin-antitoxin system RelE/ParE family toxin [Aminipila sp.]
MEWTIEYTREAKEDIKALDGTQRKQVIKAINKVSYNPLPNSEGGYGKPLGNHLTSNLAGYMKIKLLKLGLRIVYGIERKDGIMRIVIVSVRTDEEVYKMAYERIK